MIHPYEALKLENASLLSGAYILPARRAEALEVGARLLKSRPRYQAIQDETTVLIIPQAAIHERECDGNFHCALCNGERIIGTGRKTTLVPHGYGPWETFEAGAEFALHLDGLDAVSRQPEGWTQERAVYEWEKYNGFGPRNHGRHTGYNWAGTNIYDGGKYTSDGHWDPKRDDEQLGCVAIMLAMDELAPGLSMRRAMPMVTAPTLLPKPTPPPEGHKDAAKVQASLNKLGASPALAVNDNYDRITTLMVKSYQHFRGLDVDGLAGPKTWAAIERDLETVCS